MFTYFIVILLVKESVVGSLQRSKKYQEPIQQAVYQKDEGGVKQRNIKQSEKSFSKEYNTNKASEYDSNKDQRYFKQNYNEFQEDYRRDPRTNGYKQYFQENIDNGRFQEEYKRNPSTNGYNPHREKKYNSNKDKQYFEENQNNGRFQEEYKRNSRGNRYGSNREKKYNSNRNNEYYQQNVDKSRIQDEYRSYPRSNNYFNEQQNQQPSSYAAERNGKYQRNNYNKRQRYRQQEGIKTNPWQQRILSTPQPGQMMGMMTMTPQQALEQIKVGNMPPQLRDQVSEYCKGNRGSLKGSAWDDCADAYFSQTQNQKNAMQMIIANGGD